MLEGPGHDRMLERDVGLHTIEEVPGKGKEKGNSGAAGRVECLLNK